MCIRDRITSDAMQKIYLGGDPEAGLKEAADKANAVLKK